MQSAVIAAARGIAETFLLIGVEDPAHDHDHGRVAATTETGALTDVLRTDDELRAIWCSPSGAVWVGSANGVVATNAPVPISSVSRYDYFARCGTAPWQAMSLGAIETAGSGHGLPPNVHHLWGRSDDDVFVTTYRGHIYRWNGGAWRQVHDGATTDGNDLVAFAASGPGEIYVVGQQGTVLVGDGTAWRPLALPSPLVNESLTGICALTSGEVLIAGNSRKGSRILRGTSSGLSEVSRTEHELLGLACIGERVFLNTPDGVAELVDGAVTMLKALKTRAMFPAPGGLILLEPNMEQISFARHDPAASTPWLRVRCAYPRR